MGHAGLGEEYEHVMDSAKRRRAYVMALEEVADSTEGVAATVWTVWTAWTAWTYVLINGPKSHRVEKMFYLSVLNKLRKVNTEGHLRLWRLIRRTARIYL